MLLMALVSGAATAYVVVNGTRVFGGPTRAHWLAIKLNS
jgi:hypothetical protein